MSDNLNIDLVFPIRDDVSARLMWIKAELLYDAGIINAKELGVVTERAAAVVDQPEVAEAVDSKGNIYRTEVDTGKRAQKFRVVSPVVR